MNNDGWGFLGAGTSDNRMAGMDLQHNIQNRTADEGSSPKRIVTQTAESGGPMKHEELVEQEKTRHEHAMKHQRHHLENHYGRHFDSQHGHDNHKYSR